MSKGAVYIGVDQGTSSTKAALVLPSGQVVGTFAAEIDLLNPQTGHYEQSPEQILNSVQTVLEEAKHSANEQGLTVSGIGFAFQRSGVTAWERETGRSIHPLISWRDTRTQPFIDELLDQEVPIFDKTGIPPSSNYAGGKLALLQKQFPARDICVGTLDSFVMANLLDSEGSEPRPFLTDDTMAHRTMLYSFDARGWDGELASAFGIDARRLARVVPSVSEIGAIEGVPVRVLIGDQQASLLGALSPQNRTVLTLGSIGSLVHFSGESVHRVPGFISSILCSTAESGVQYFTEGTVNCCSETVKRAVMLGVAKEEISECCVVTEASNPGIIGFCPFGNTTTPDWEYGLENAIPNYAQLSNQEIVLVLVQNLAHFLIENILAFKGYGLLGTEILATGGVANVDYLLQYLANASGVPIKRMRGQTSGARGVALAAAYRDKFLSQSTVPKSLDGEVFMPDPDRVRYIQEQLGQWQALRERVRAGDVKDTERVPGDLWIH